MSLVVHVRGGSLVIFGNVCSDSSRTAGERCNWDLLLVTWPKRSWSSAEIMQRWRKQVLWANHKEMVQTASKQLNEQEIPNLKKNLGLILSQRSRLSTSATHSLGEFQFGWLWKTFVFSLWANCDMRVPQVYLNERRNLVEKIGRPR